MLSHNFLVYGQAPWGESTTLSEKFLERGRVQLLQGKFEEASRTFSHLIANREKHQHVEWAYLLRCYTYRLDAYFRSGMERYTLMQISSVDYTCAAKINADLAYKECQGYGLIVTWLECLLALFKSQGEKINFPKIHEQLWCIFLSDNLFHREKINEALEVANEGLQKLPSNHFLLFTRSAVWLTKAVEEANPSLFDKAEADLTQAIQASPALPESAPNLARYYFHRGQIRYMQKRVEGMMEDFRNGMAYDFADNDAFDTNFRLATLKQVLMAYIIPSISLDKQNLAKVKHLKHLTAEIVKDRTKSDLYLHRGKIYAELGQENFALFDYSLALWLIKTHLDKSPGCTQKMVEAKIELLKKKQVSAALNTEKIQESVSSSSSSSSTKEESKEPIPDSAESLAKKKQKRERQKKAKEDRQEMQSFMGGLLNQIVSRAKAEIEVMEAKKRLEAGMRGLVSGLAKNAVLLVKEKERKREEEAQKQLKEQQRKKQQSIRQAQDLVYGLVDRAVLIADEKKQRQAALEQGLRTLVYGLTEKASLIADEKQQKRAALEQELRTLVYDLSEKVPLIAKQNEDKRKEAELKEEEKLFFQSLDRVFVPSQVADLGRRLKALPGRAAKRTHLYGGKARDEVLMNGRESLDFDLRTALPLSVAAPIMREVFQLAEEPKVENGLLQLNFPMLVGGGARKLAVLALSHSEYLANEAISYAEALRRDAYSLDFIQNAFIATFPESGSVCPVFYPLDWWELYFSASPITMASQLERTRHKQGLSQATMKVTGNAIFLVGEAKSLTCYFFVNGSLVNHLRHELTLNVELEASERQGLLLNENGRVVMTPENQKVAKVIFARLNDAYQKVWHSPLDRLKGRVGERILMLKQMEPILEASLSFSHDPIRMLRAIYFTSALGYSTLGETVETGIRFNLQNYLLFLRCQPGKLNSWMNKLLCREGKPKLIAHFNELLRVGLLGLSFPGLVELVLSDDLLKQWLDRELQAAVLIERLSLNYLYSLFIVCLAVSGGKAAQEVIQQNLLFTVNFQAVDPGDFLRIAFKSWHQFWQAQLPKSSEVQVNLNVKVNLQVNQFQYVNLGQTAGATFFPRKTAETSDHKQPTNYNPAYYQPG
jgi:hypothetical protein